MPLSISSVRRIGFLLGWERVDVDDERISNQDDLSCTVTIFCSFLITIVTPIYYKLNWQKRKSDSSKLGQRIMNQIAFVSIPPSIFCICNTIYFISEVAFISNLPFTKNSSCIRKAVSIIMTVSKTFSEFIFAYNSIIFYWHVVFFQTLLSCFIILLAIQRFFLIFLPESVHCVIKPKALRIYIIIIWIASTLHGCLIFALLYSIISGRSIKNPEHYFNRLSYISFGFIVLVTLIYIAIFVYLYRMPRANKWNRPEVALLYEGVPLLITNIFIFYHILSDVDNVTLYNRYLNYGMRKVVISTALIQFTHVFTFERIANFFSTDLRVILNRRSLVAPMTS